VHTVGVVAVRLVSAADKASDETPCAARLTGSQEDTKMSDRTVVGLIRVTVVIGGALAVIGSLVVIAIGYAGAWWQGFGAFLALLSIFFAVFVWLVISQQPRNPVVWTMAGSAFFGGLSVAALVGATMSVQDDPNLVNLVWSTNTVVVVTADLPVSTAWLLLFANPASIVAIFPLLTFGLLLFPDGRLPSPRWRWVGILAAAAITVTTVSEAWGYRPGNTTVADQGLLLLLALVALMFAVVLSLAALVVRFRRSSGAARQQFKWVMWGASIFAPAIVVAVIFGGTRYQDLILIPMMAAEATFLVSYGIAVGRYRLFDIDIVIRRTAVYAIVVGLLAVVYIGAVFALRSLLPGGNDLAVVASTLAVAGLFNPLRGRVQGFVDRSFYRSHYNAQQLVEEFSSHLQNEVDLAQITAEWLDAVDRAVKPTSAAVWIRPTNKTRKTRTTLTRHPEQTE